MGKHAVDTVQAKPRGRLGVPGRTHLYVRKGDCVCVAQRSPSWIRLLREDRGSRCRAPCPGVTGNAHFLTRARRLWVHLETLSSTRSPLMFYPWPSGSGRFCMRSEGSTAAAPRLSGQKVLGLRQRALRRHPQGSWGGSSEPTKQTACKGKASLPMAPVPL